MTQLKALNDDQNLYVTAIEESVELSLELMSLAHTMIKGLRFGLDDVGPRQFEANRNRISAEANDFIAMLVTLHARGLIILSDKAVNDKLIKVEQYLQYARNKHALELTDGERFRKLIKQYMNNPSNEVQLSEEDLLEAMRHHVDSMP